MIIFLDLAININKSVKFNSINHNMLNCKNVFSCVCLYQSLVFSTPDDKYPMQSKSKSQKVVLVVTRL